MAIIAQNWSISALAVEIGKHKTTIAKIISDANVEPVARKGRSNLYRMSHVIAAMLDSEELDLQQEKAKQAKASTERIELQNAEKKRELISADEFVEALERVVSEIVSRLEALPLELKKNTPSLSAHDIELIKKTIAECRNNTHNSIINIIKDLPQKNVE